MPKSQFIDPSILHKKDEIKLGCIQVNAYSGSAKDEIARLGRDKLLAMYRAMAIIREFETALADFAEKGSYKGLRYSYQGPIHLCIGEEASAVGQAFALQKDDYIFGSHRSHGELIAKGLCYIADSTGQELAQIMDTEPQISKMLDGNKYDSTSAKAEDFLLYGAMCEIFGKFTGFQRGFGGSMHIFFAPFGVYPNNAIVGASAPIATGAALYKKLHSKNSIAVANIGDGALGCGVVYEAMNFAAMDQYTELWDNKGGLPILFNIIDNGYGMGGQTDGETMAYGAPARVGAGISPTALHAQRINGNNPLAVYDATLQQRELLVNGKGPALLDVVTYRIKGHSQSDSMQYREQAEIDEWLKYDPLKLYKKDLMDSGITTACYFDKLHSEIEGQIYRICQLALDAPDCPKGGVSEYLKSVTFSNTVLQHTQDGTLAPKQDNLRYRQISAKQRSGIDSDGKQTDKDAITINDAIFEAVFEGFYRDNKLITYGEDVRDWGGVCSVYKGLTQTLPYEKLFNTPISEAAIVATAVGYAMCGGRAVIEIMFADFLARAGDEIFNQLAKWQAMSGGTLKIPVIVRVSVGTKYGTQHSQDWSALVSHIPGLKVVYPVTPYECKGLMNTALCGSDPVIFFESQSLYSKAEYFNRQGVPTDYYTIPIGLPSTKRQGKDITIITLGAALYSALQAADILADKGIDAEVIDAVTLSPFGYKQAAASVQKTGRLAVITFACANGAVAQTIACNLTSMCFACLKAAPIVIGTPDTIVPPVKYEQEYFPTAEQIVQEISSKLFC